MTNSQGYAFLMLCYRTIIVTDLSSVHRRILEISRISYVEFVFFFFDVVNEELNRKFILSRD